MLHARTKRVRRSGKLQVERFGPRVCEGEAAGETSLPAPYRRGCPVRVEAAPAAAPPSPPPYVEAPCLLPAHRSALTAPCSPPAQPLQRRPRPRVGDHLASSHLRGPAEAVPARLSDARDGQAGQPDPDSLPSSGVAGGPVALLPPLPGGLVSPLGGSSQRLSTITMGGVRASLAKPAECRRACHHHPFPLLYPPQGGAAVTAAAYALTRAAAVLAPPRNLPGASQGRGTAAEHPPTRNPHAGTVCTGASFDPARRGSARDDLGGTATEHVTDHLDRLDGQLPPHRRGLAEHRGQRRPEPNHPGGKLGAVMERERPFPEQAKREAVHLGAERHVLLPAGYSGTSVSSVAWKSLSQLPLRRRFVQTTLALAFLRADQDASVAQPARRQHPVQ